MNWKLITGISLIMAILIFALGWCSKPDMVITKVVTKIDTTTNFISLPVFVEIVKIVPKYKPLVINRTDTLFNSFLSEIDTSHLPALIDSTNLYLTTAFDIYYKNISEVTKDTHEVTFFFPNNHFVFTERPAPRKEIVINKEIIKFIEKKQAWYDEQWFRWTCIGAAFIGGVYAGSQIGGSK
jgi:hypothetical protein